jgi:hypothetical protein
MPWTASAMLKATSASASETRSYRATPMTSSRGVPSSALPGRTATSATRSWWSTSVSRDSSRAVSRRTGAKKRR